jgi:hypothetical protein
MYNYKKPLQNSSLSLIRFLQKKGETKWSIRMLYVTSKNIKANKIKIKAGVESIYIYVLSVSIDTIVILIKRR